MAHMFHAMQVMQRVIIIPDRGFMSYRFYLKPMMVHATSCHTGYAAGDHHARSRLDVLQVLCVAHDGTRSFVPHRLYAI
jgi:hypothetical protein